MPTLEQDLAQLCEYVKRLPLGEIFSLQDWLASHELAYLLALRDRLDEAVLSTDAAADREVERALALAFALASLESSLACSEMGRMRFLAEDRSEKTPYALRRLQGVLRTEVLRRSGVLEVRRLSMVPGEPVWITLTESWRQGGRYLRHPDLLRLMAIIPVDEWGSGPICRGSG